MTIDKSTMTGDYVVGSFTSQGTRVKDGFFVGSPDAVAVLHKKYMDSARRNGEVFDVSALPAQPTQEHKKVKTYSNKNGYNGTRAKAQRKEEEKPPVLPTPPPTPTPKEMYTVVFENEFGKIKVRAVDVLVNQNAYCIVFLNEDSMTFEPKIGQKIFIYLNDNKKISVYYPGIVFNWTDDRRKLMILIRNEQDESD